MLAKFAGCRGCWRGCWRLSGAIRTVFTVFFEGRATWHQKPVARPGMLRRSLGCNKTRQRYTLQVGLPTLFELEDTQRSWIVGSLFCWCFALPGLRRSGGLRRKHARLRRTYASNPRTTFSTHVSKCAPSTARAIRPTQGSPCALNDPLKVMCLPRNLHPGSKVLCLQRNLHEGSKVLRLPRT